jgi:hypothetical protein
MLWARVSMIRHNITEPRPGLEYVVEGSPSNVKWYVVTCRCTFGTHGLSQPKPEKA